MIMIFDFLKKCEYEIRTAEELKKFCALEESLWTATSSSIENFTCDKTFLKYLDSDKNGRIRTDELVQAQKWTLEILSDLSRLEDRNGILRIDTINSSVPEGATLKAASERILSNLGKSESPEISLEDVRNRQKIVSAGISNGDGVIPAESVADPEVKDFISDIMLTTGDAIDSSGLRGVSQSHLDGFAKSVSDYLEWHSKSEPGSAEYREIMLLGEKTAASYDALSAVKEKIDEYFRFCGYVRFRKSLHDEHATESQPLQGEDHPSIDDIDRYLESAPLAKPEVTESLSLDKNINPLFQERIGSFKTNTLQCFKQDTDSLAISEWNNIVAKFAPYSRWLAGKKGANVEKLGLVKIKGYNQDKKLVHELENMIRRDLAVAVELDQIENVEKLILFQKWLIPFANNFITFSSLLNPKTISMIQIGTLIMDGRSFNLTVRVGNIEEHKRIAQKSNICIIYLDIFSKTGDDEDKMNIAAAITSGDMNRLFKGKLGIFFTPDGREWDAKITDMLVNPVSFTEAIQTPFRKLGSFIERQAENFSASKYSSLEKNLGQGLPPTAATPSPVVAGQPDKTQPSGTIRDLMLGGSVAIAALGSAFAFITNSLKGVTLLHVICVMIGLVCIVTLPVTLVAIVKLRQRNLSIFFEAAGWSLNIPLKLTYRLGRIFTSSPSNELMMLANFAEVRKRNDRVEFLVLLAFLVLAALLGIIAGKIAGILF